MTDREDAITTEALTKSFRTRKGQVDAVNGVDLRVGAGEIFGLLGPNGAGKTTTMRMLTTLLPIDSGRATVAGLDVARQPQRVRETIGYVSQLGGADELATGRENLQLQGRLYGAGLTEVRPRVDELADLLDMSGFIDRRVKTYSGGQRRRLDVALGIVHQPTVLFLDEPTTGLDPQARLADWDTIAELTSEGTTVLLTTQYLDEADRLADSITVLAAGRVVASGTAAELKARVGRRTVTTSFTKDRDPAAAVTTAAAAIAATGLEPVTDPGRGSVVTPVTDAHDVTTVILAIDRAGLEATELRIAEPTLDDVYLSLAGPGAGHAAYPAAAARTAA